MYCPSSPVCLVDETGCSSAAEQGTTAGIVATLGGANAGALQRFMEFVTRSLEQSLNRLNIQLLIEFVEDGTIESWGGAGRIVQVGQNYAIQLGQGADIKVLLHEIGELFFRLSGQMSMPHGMYTEAAEELFRSFIGGG